MRFPLSVTKGAPDDMRARALAPSTSSDSRVASMPKSTTSTGTGVARPKPIHHLAAVDHDRKAVARGGDNLLTQQGAAESPLIRLSVPRSTSSAPSIVKSIWRCSLNEDERNVRRLRPCGRALRSGNADKAQTLPTTPCKCFATVERRRRAAAKSNDHVTLDQLQPQPRRRHA